MPGPLTLLTDAGEEQLELGEFEVRVRRGEVAPGALVKLPIVTGDRFVPARELELFRGFHQPRRLEFAKGFRLDRVPVVTLTLIAANVAAFVLLQREAPVDVDSVVRFGGKVRPLIFDLGEVWRLLTANFLHRDWLHLGLNMFVLLNVGLALENVYRKVDYLWLLVLSGVATMVVSLWLSDAVSLGASGIIYGCLGGVVVFGLRYRLLLPGRYRRVLSEAALPAVIGLLAIGLRSKGVDNWAHFGGLLAGVAAALPMRPRLLSDELAPWKVWLLALRSGLLLAAVLAAESVISPRLPLFASRVDDVHGITVPIPAGWRRGANRFGQLAYFNGLPGFGRATVAAEAFERAEAADALDLARTFVQRTLGEEAIGADARTIEAGAPVRRVVGGLPAAAVTARLSEPFGTSRLEALLVLRGDLVYQLVFTFPEAFPGYEAVIRRMIDGVAFEETRSLRMARAKLLLFPNTASSLGGLGEVLRREGALGLAADTLAEAVALEPANVRLRVERSRALFQLERSQEACLSAEAAALYGPDDPSALEAWARCALSLGDAGSALERLTRARALAPDDERLQEVERRLRQAIGDLSLSPPEKTSRVRQ